MRSLTIRLDDADFDRLEREAARRGNTPEALTETLLRAGLEDAEVRGRAVQLVREMSQASGLSVAEAERVAHEEVEGMRSERRAGRS